MFPHIHMLVCTYEYTHADTYTTYTHVACTHTYTIHRDTYIYLNNTWKGLKAVRQEKLHGMRFFGLKNEIIEVNGTVQGWISGVVRNL